jgi:hypothetical protein
MYSIPCGQWQEAIGHHVATFSKGFGNTQHTAHYIAFLLSVNYAVKENVSLGRKG